MSLQLEAFLTDFPDAQTRAITLDNATLQDAFTISSEYADLVSLGARQTFGALEVTISNDTDGNWNVSDIQIFMKDLGNSG